MSTKLMQSELIEHATDLLEVCDRDLTTEKVGAYFRAYFPAATKEQRHQILLTALSLL